MSDMKIRIGHEVPSGKPVTLDLDYAIEERMFIFGGSGSGKSYLARDICEKANGKVQQIIISPKKEFVTLREKFNYIHVGTRNEKASPDIELNTRYAGQLAIKILESGTDAIIEFSENTKERVKYVKNFIEGILEAPEHLWHPVMIVIDEIQIWAPEKGHGEAESLEAIADLASIGRDKGFFLVAVTQRVSKFNKDVAAELGIKFIGKATLDNDQIRAAQELGIPTKEKSKLRDLGRPNFHFYAFGPGLSDDVILMKADETQTTHVSGYKRNKMQKPIPTPKQVKSIISSFSDLPKEAENKLKTEADLKRKIQEQNQELNSLRRQQPKQDPQAIERARLQGFNEAKRQYEAKIKDLKFYCRKFQSTFEGIAITSKTHAEMRFDDETPIKEPSISKIVNKDSTFTSPNIHPGETVTTEPPIETDGEINPCMQKVLNTLATINKPVSRKTLAVISKYSHKSGGYQTAVKKLREMGLITENGDVEITDAGRGKATEIDVMPSTPEDLIAFWKNKLGACPGAILQHLHSIYPNSETRAEVAAATKYSPTSGGFQTAVKKLRELGLATEESLQVKLSEEFFI